ncbi:protein prenyltransferase alpha subunit repeat-containing protein 1-A [Phymastichus coffea]|uniref:protein prenyltransferase alpha subunit repeat-containing protein 1-A n=1 Tax=Phymastichus coffea TaxID=108790 RepID=UPI00273A9674|nr:protein prenyltransferase alpha subunit repeat-containing protein 1-A [Phymastichus coffea]
MKKLENNFFDAEKILFDIESVIGKDFNLSTFEIIPLENNSNISPVIQNGRSLGLASWCIKPLFCYVYRHILETKRNLSQATTTCISRWLLGALVLNPDVCTFWNMRRELMQNNKLDPISELHFVNIVIYRKAQSFEAFSYRRWLLTLMLHFHKEILDTESLLRKEYEVTTIAATKHRNNWLAWTYRTYIVLIFRQIFVDKFFSYLYEEWEQSTIWCNSHISDFSGFAYRQFLLWNLLLYKAGNIKKNRSVLLKRHQKNIYKFISVANDGYKKMQVSDKEFTKGFLDLFRKKSNKICSGNDLENFFMNLSYWTEDCLLNEELINIFPDHETLWYHRRFLVICFLALTNNMINLLSVRNTCLFKNEFYNGNSNYTSLLLSNDVSLKDVLTTAFRIRNRKLISLTKNDKTYVHSHKQNFFRFLIRHHIKP